ncbi:MAG TPA: hypothetical protein ENH38_09450 [Nitrospirae bacterium]|nr:hypothetical protein [Nitrospirota bacterium]HDZ88823.1 hypothetical protein [Nitrospirota bacterium]
MPERYTFSSDNFNIRKLGDIPRSEYNNYKKFASDGNAYVIVHPAYYVYIQNGSDQGIDNDNMDNIVKNFMIGQVRKEREFITAAAKTGKLVLLVIPGKWYSRAYIDYLNTITAGAQSVIFIESKSRNSGRISKNDLVKLKDFFLNLGVTNIVIGGGYVGRCQDHVYQRLSKAFGYDTVAIAPEISSFAPSDISAATVKMFMPSGSLFDFSFRVMTTYIKNNKGNNHNLHPNVREIPAF